MSTPFIVVIPARYASTRLPGKPLLDIAGKPMIQHVWERALESSAKQVYIATDDERIKVACQAFKAPVLMTDDHRSGTDRLEEIATKLNLADDEIIVNVQGDEPLIPASIIDQVANNLALYTEARIATLSEPIKELDGLFNPNFVKVVTDRFGYALSFSRAPMPWARDAMLDAPDTLPAGIPFRRHIGLYAYRAGFLHDYVAWGSCWLERCEMLEQLRALWNGVKIHVGEAIEVPPAGVDTIEDLERVKQLLEQK